MLAPHSTGIRERRVQKLLGDHGCDRFAHQGYGLATLFFPSSFPLQHRLLTTSAVLAGLFEEQDKPESALECGPLRPCLFASPLAPHLLSSCLCEKFCATEVRGRGCCHHREAQEGERRAEARERKSEGATAGTHQASTVTHTRINMLGISLPFFLNCRRGWPTASAA